MPDHRNGELRKNSDIVLLRVGLLAVLPFLRLGHNNDEFTVACYELRTFLLATSSNALNLALASEAFQLCHRALAIILVAARRSGAC